MQIQLDAAEQSDVKVGDPVTITLPDNSTTPGRVSLRRHGRDRPSSSDQGGGGSSTPTIEVDVTPTDPAATGNLDQAPVNVSITTGSVSNALVVPVDALLALASGGYARRGDRRRRRPPPGRRSTSACSTTPTASSRSAAAASPPGSASWCRAYERRPPPPLDPDRRRAPAGDGAPDTVLELDA